MKTTSLRALVAASLLSLGPSLWADPIASTPNLAKAPPPSETPAAATPTPLSKPAEAAPAGPAVLEAAPGVWLTQFTGMTAVWADLGDGIVLIDTGGSAKDAKTLKSFVSLTAKDKPIKWLVLTHLHGHVNSAEGLLDFLSPETTVYVHSRVSEAFKNAVVMMAREVPPTVAVSGTMEIKGKKRSLELTALSSPAHSNHDIFALLPDISLAVTGDLLTPGSCPDLTDPSADLVGVLAALDILEKKNVKGIVGSSGGSSDPAAEIDVTRGYLRRLLKLLFENKQENTPAAKVASIIRLDPLQGYCPTAMDSRNAISLYERMGPDGRLTPGNAARPKAQNE
ncbi:MAG: MBL fold metallo-hydrolase [Thermoanaerobaculia bacterium]|nr:MBL fold metallo-hydrolase [Thermoanaerobaculia bacterium]